MNTRTRSQSKNITAMDQSKPKLISNNTNSELMKLYEEISALDKLIEQNKRDQIEKVLEFRKLCIKRKENNEQIACNKCRNLKENTPYRFTSNPIRVRPIGDDYSSLGGDYENNVYLCGECGRPGIELRSIDENCSYSSYQNRHL